MFTPKLNTPNRSRSFQASKSTKDRRSIGLFTPPKRSPFTRTSNLNRSSLQTSVIVETDSAQHRLEAFGSPLPVLVTEALTLADRNVETSVNLDATGWLWLVCGRRLFVWRYKPSQFNKSSQCKELTLPPSDLAHRAELVTILTNPGDTSAACVAVSPEGAVRYWPSVTHEGAFVEISADLKGEECAVLVGLQSFQCILATTTSSLLLLTPSQGQNTIHSKILRVPQGMLTGVSRRMSSFFFGSASAQQPGATLHQVLPGEEIEEGHCFYNLSGSNLQKWLVSGSSETFLYQCDVERLIRECMADTIWGQDVTRIPSLKTWLIDMQPTRDGVVVLGAGMNPDISNQLYYVLGTLHTEGNDPPQSFLSFTVSRFMNVYQEEEESRLLGYRLLLPDPSKSSAYLYDARNIICVSVSSSSYPLDKAEFQAPGEKILGGGQCDRLALFFSNAHGLTTMKEVHQPNVSMNESVTIEPLSDSVLGSVTANMVQEMSMSEDKTARLKAAFLHSCRGNVAGALTILEDLFPADMTNEPGSALDSLITLLSQEVIDDFPASDPRWAESIPQDGAYSSSSLILQHQLEDKLKAHDCYITFLKNIGLWERLTSTRVRDSHMCTRLLLCEHAEKVCAAMTLRALHTQHIQRIDNAIRQVLEMRGELRKQSGLTPQDVFYRQVSGIQEILEVLVQQEEEELTTDLSPRETILVISSINHILISMLHEGLQHRQAKAGVYQAHPSSPQPHYLPWTSTTGNRGMRALLHKQHTLTVEQALATAQDTQERGTLFQQLLEITDILLDGYKCQLESIRQAAGDAQRYHELLRKYEQERTNLITPFMRHEQYERAASLAEKYCDFAILVQLCEETNNQERLHRYMNQFSNKGFSDFVFKWYVKEGKTGKLMSSSLSSHPQLGSFLQTGENTYMSWLHDINTGDFYKAHQTLQSLAVEESSAASKKKTLLSLSKLCALATDDAPLDLQDTIDGINDEQDLLLHQEGLPQHVVEALGMDADNMKVLPPRELIELYISDYNSNSNEFDFKKALDLLNYVDKSDQEVGYENLLLHIWCRAILRDSWTDINPENPLDNSKETVFFKTVELAYTYGMDLREYLPSVERLLTADEIGNLRDNATFQYIVKAGYEQVQRILA